MLQPNALATAFILGAIVGLVGPLIRVRRRPLLPPSVASPSPALTAEISLAVSERYPDVRRLAYATVSVFERNSPDSTVFLFPARGAHLGAIRLDDSGPDTPAGRAARILAGMNLNCGVLVIPLATR
ncbi:hypothetical protein [Streptomyces sp. NPDC059949]|uniref:hypothetical protein n=1 Tax=Streptomyces sp. NPDC059949 TaxID=3347013 RepID=UPI0036472FBC